VCQSHRMHFFLSFCGITYVDQCGLSDLSTFVKGSHTFVPDVYDRRKANFVCTRAALFWAHSRLLILGSFVSNFTLESLGTTVPSFSLVYAGFLSWNYILRYESRPTSLCFMISLASYSHPGEHLLPYSELILRPNKLISTLGCNT
jgi:hypothetical protein